MSVCREMALSKNEIKMKVLEDVYKKQKVDNILRVKFGIHKPTLSEKSRRTPARCRTPTQAKTSKHI